MLTGLWGDIVHEDFYGEPLLDDVDRPSMIDDEEDEDHFLARLVGHNNLEALTEEPAGPETEWDGE